MFARRVIVLLSTLLALALASGTARAQSPTLVNKNGVVKKAASAKDEAGKPMKLKKGEKILIIYERGEWYWVKNKKGQQAWFLKKNLTLKPDKTKPEPEPTPEPEPVATAQPEPEPAAVAVEPAGDAAASATTTTVTTAGAGTTTTAAAPDSAASTGTPAVAAPAGGTSALAAGLPSMGSFKRAGRLSVLASERGAQVKVDGRDVGQAPVSGLQVRGGTHTVAVEKAGFVTGASQVEVDGDDVQAALALVPTDETRQAHEGTAGLLRLIGYGGLGLGGLTTLAGLGVAGFGQLESAAARQAIYDYNEQPVRTDAEYRELVGRRDTASTLLVAGEIALVSGLVVAAAGLAAYMLAGDPDRYAAYRAE